MIEDDATRFALQTKLLQRVEALGLQQALFPSDREPINEIVQQLESINPIPQPLHTDYLPSLLGNWQLVYASKGTVVTRQLASIPDFGGTINIKRVWQRLVAGGTRKISACNGAFLDLPLLGEWRLQADGVWTWGADEKKAKVTFDSFSMQATKLFGMESWSFPELKIPVLEFLGNEAEWTTSYLDEEIRVGRGATGNLFVFRRE
ncbi:PAP fibrillin [Coleofasciculus sp. FACHB-64]|uniref:PAP/fibrillin family protein n=1 Tax=Cyanophyceae TaxID=3028117 RepID=UPI001689D962|nr:MULTISPECIES: PAP/fibrillin family protein [unclassified Coleofasciculus]MBD1836749.1 PAP fibrillin [Coleofasciculus sp. FACHB-501]MBD2045996.1 PAP fibrillin [Coleofasciculus sp. FACHB-64]